MSETDVLLAGATRRAPASDRTLSQQPARRVAVVTCMDARVDPAQILGLRDGDAHVLRNAGAIATDDVLRSLAVSQRFLGTVEIMVIHHTDCGALGYSDAEWRRELQVETAVEPPWSAQVSTDIDANVRAGLETIRSSPFLVATDSVRGFVYDVRTGELREVAAEGPG
jgi:carbonic anhydrase